MVNTPNWFLNSFIVIIITLIIIIIIIIIIIKFRNTSMSDQLLLTKRFISLKRSLRRQAVLIILVLFCDFSHPLGSVLHG